MNIPMINDGLDTYTGLRDTFSFLLNDRKIFLTGEINDEKAALIISQLLCLEKINADDDITLYINSPGGDVYAGISVLNTLQNLACPVSTVCTGLAASMAAILLAAGTNGKRFAYLDSEVMMHQPIGGSQGQVSDIEINARHLIKLKNRINHRMATFTGKSFDQITQDTERDFYLDAYEAKDYGLIDEIIL